ncbi:MADS-box transcription factor [Trema orientale]|uniref:MADS-box transcription factor n=1 Tax=Trema orientale TaxID=63057 RepID=A0A2P5FKS1_TREOI|nr:MADS-box transcription factor [Trema orientale]
MTRRKIRLAWIGNDTSRKASFKKRRAGLLKKVSELSTLCGVSAFIVIYGPGESDPPTVWPSVEVARQLYERFISVPDIERCKKMVNQEGYLRERATKMAEQLRKQHRKNKEKMTCHVMRQVEAGKPLNEFETSELGSVVWVLEEKMKEIKRRIEYYDQTVGIQPPGSLLLPPPMIPMEELLMGDQSWESFFGGIMSNLNNNNNNNIVNTNNNSLAVLRGIDQGNSVGMQVPDQRFFLGGTSTLGTTSLGSNYNTVQPFYGAGISSSSGGGTGNGLGFQPYVSHQSFGNNINNNSIVTSNDQMGLGNFGYFGSRGGSGGFSDMGLAPQQLNLGGINNNLGGTSTDQAMGNITGSSSTSVQNPNFGLNVGSVGGVINENVGFGLHSGQGSTLGGNNNIGNNITHNNLLNQFFAFNGGNNAEVVGQGQENNQGNQSNNGGSTNVNGGDTGKNMPSGLLSGASGGTYCWK